MMPGVAWLLVLLLLALLVAALHSWQRAPARSKIPRAQKHRVEALQRMEALARRLREQEPSLDPRPILELPLDRLVQKLWDEELSLESVLCSYLEEALTVHQEVNCLTDFLDECEEQLQALKKLKKTERGLLYGVPISLKDPFNCKGHDSTCGLAQFLEKPAAKDGVIVKVLKAQGAIPFVKTNIPQTLFSSECSNPIYGQTLNPLCLKKSPGGSSGARESCLHKGVPSWAWVLTPEAASAYQPAFVVSVASGQQDTVSVTTVAGPMARDVESLVLCLRALLSEDMHRLDPTVPFMPFREEIYSSNQPLRIGYCESDGFTQPSPSMARAMRLTSRLLQDAGHQVIPFSIPRIEYAVKHLFVGGLFADGGATLLEKLEGDIVDPCMKTMINQLRLPDLLKCFLAWILKYIEPRASQNLEEMRGVRTPKKLWEQHSAVEEYRQEFIARWRSLDLDVLLTPAVDPAFDVGYSGKASVFSPLKIPRACLDLPTDSFSYLHLYNILNFPIGVVRVTSVTPQDEEDLAFYKGYYGDSSDTYFREALQGSVGLPVAVQCIALPWEEELCLRFMKEVETLVKNHREPEL